MGKSDANFYIIGFTFSALGYAAWVRFLYDLRWQPQSWAGTFMQKPIRGLALCSYSIYLTHPTFFALIGSLGFVEVLPHVFGKLAVFVGTVLLGVVFYFSVEQPAITTRDRFLRSESA